ncbi:hypothetical protein EON63_15160 [archaeon]|nr:MAG: hypothetical protein EON63_15160 [archaeon]
MLWHDFVPVPERWSPYEIAAFEAAIALYGKNFHTIQTYVSDCTFIFMRHLTHILTMFPRLFCYPCVYLVCELEYYNYNIYFVCVCLLYIQVTTKTTQEVIAFYYDWKKTSHYTQWKQTYTVDERDFE